MDRTSGNVTGLERLHGYDRHLQPDLLRLACVSAGVSPPTGELQHYLQLGCGPGLSLHIHAAANPGNFWGADLDPGQAPLVAALAAARGMGARVLDESIGELAARPDLPQFDVIALPGIWTRSSVENRRAILDLVRRNLRVGGLVYVSYDCFPGWAPAEPLRHLMSLHSDLVGPGAAGPAGKVESALGFARTVADAGALLFRANPAIVERLKRIAEENPSSLANEYVDGDWDLMAFSDVARSLGEAKLSFAASAHLLDHLDSFNLSADGAKLLAGIQHPVLRQTVRDYLVNQQSRRDVFVKGLRRLAPLERGEALMAQSFMLGTSPGDVPLKVQGSHGDGTLPEHIHRPLIEVLAENHHEPKSLRHLVGHDRLKAIPRAHVTEAVLALTGTGHVSTARVPTAESRARSRAYNQQVCQHTSHAGDIAFLASPVTGSGIPVGRVEQLFLLALRQGRSTQPELAAHAWELLAAQGRRFVEEGKAIEVPEQSIAHLTGLASLFIDKRLPILKALQIV